MPEYRKYIIKVARELYYPLHVIDALKVAQSEAECTRIMTNARCSQEWR